MRSSVAAADGTLQIAIKNDVIPFDFDDPQGW
jgi:hypothetical protein